MRSFVFNSLGGLFSGKYLIVFSYEVDGNHFNGEFLSSSERKEGSTFPLRYDPDDPEQTDRSDDDGSLLGKVATLAGGIALRPSSSGSERENRA
jgi:hypothetical protein